jgi:hypothetical protein
VYGVAELDADEALPVPQLFVAVTVNVYAIPLVNPPTLPLLMAGIKPVQPPHAGDGVIVYPLIDAPLLAAAVHVKLTFPNVPVAVAEGVPGAPGTAPGMAEFEAGEDPLVPAPFVAVYVNV